MKSFFTKNVIIALTVIISLCLLYWGIEFLKGINLFKPANYYEVRFEKVEGLNVASPVMLNGFQVGQVAEINYDYKTNEVVVEISLDKELQVPMGSTITLVNSLMGAGSLQLTLSQNTAYYKVGDVIPSQRQPGLMNTVSEDMMPQVVDILPKVDSIMGNVNALTADPALLTSVARLDGITAQLAQSSIELNQLMRQLNGQVPGIMTNVNQFTGKLNTMGSDLNDMTAHYKNLPIDSTLNSLNQTVDNLRQLTGELNTQINSKNSSLGLLLNDRQLYDNANHSLASLDSLLRDVKRNPKRYINIKVF